MSSAMSLIDQTALVESFHQILDNSADLPSAVSSAIRFFENYQRRHIFDLMPIVSEAAYIDLFHECLSDESLHQKSLSLIGLLIRVTDSHPAVLEWLEGIMRHVDLALRNMDAAVAQSIALDIVRSLLEQDADFWIRYFLNAGRTILDDLLAIPSPNRQEATPTALLILTHFISVVGEDDRQALFDGFWLFRSASERGVHALSGVFELMKMSESLAALAIADGICGTIIEVMAPGEEPDERLHMLCLEMVLWRLQRPNWEPDWLISVIGLVLREGYLAYFAPYSAAFDACCIFLEVILRPELGCPAVYECEMFVRLLPVIASGNYHAFQRVLRVLVVAAESGGLWAIPGSREIMMAVIDRLDLSSMKIIWMLFHESHLPWDVDQELIDRIRAKCEELYETHADLGEAAPEIYDLCLTFLS
jgi:hypothetical protein